MLFSNRASQVHPASRADAGSCPEGERGNALVEFIGLGALLMIPTVYFLLSVFALQSGAFAAASASQQALQFVQQLPAEQRSQGAAQNIAQLAASDYGIDPGQVTAVLGCERSCGQGERLTVDVTVQVELPLVPWPGAPSMGTMTSQAVSWGSKYS